MEVCCLSAVAAEVGAAVGTRVVYVLALVDTARDQAAPQSASEMLEKILC